MDPMLAQTATVAETGATEFLANLSVTTITLLALALTIGRFILLQLAGPATAAEPRTGARAFFRSLAEIFESLVVAGVLVFLIIRPFFVQAFFIPSESMEPTLLGHNAGVNRRTGETREDTVHDHIFVNKLVYRYSEPHHSDIIVFKAPKEADAESKFAGLPQQENVLIKRLIGVQGDKIEVKNGAVYRNGQKLNEPNAEDIKKTGKTPASDYIIKEPISDPQPPGAVFGVEKPIILGPDELFVMGDNRNDSNDSRYWGPLKRNRVIGKANFIFWPMSRFGSLH